MVSDKTTNGPPWSFFGSEKPHLSVNHGYLFQRQISFLESRSPWKKLKTWKVKTMTRWWNGRLWNLQSAYSLFFMIFDTIVKLANGHLQICAHDYITNTSLYGHSRRLLDLKFSRELLKMLETQCIQKVVFSRGNTYIWILHIKYHMCPRKSSCIIL